MYIDCLFDGHFTADAAHLFESCDAVAWVRHIWMYIIPACLYIRAYNLCICSCWTASYRRRMFSAHSADGIWCMHNDTHHRSGPMVSDVALFITLDDELDRAANKYRQLPCHNAWWWLTVRQVFSSFKNDVPIIESPWNATVESLLCISWEHADRISEQWH